MSNYKVTVSTFKTVCMKEKLYNSLMIDVKSIPKIIDFLFYRFFVFNQGLNWSFFLILEFNSPIYFDI